MSQGDHLSFPMLLLACWRGSAFVLCTEEYFCLCEVLSLPLATVNKKGLSSLLNIICSVCNVLRLYVCGNTCFLFFKVIADIHLYSYITNLPKDTSTYNWRCRELNHRPSYWQSTAQPPGPLGTKPTIFVQNVSQTRKMKQTLKAVGVSSLSQE